MVGDKRNSSTAVAWRRKVRWTIGWKDFKLPLSSNYLINILKSSQNTSTNTVNVNGNTNEKLIPEHSYIYSKTMVRECQCLNITEYQLDAKCWVY